MDIDVFPSRELPAVLRVLRTALRTNGTLAEAERMFLATYAAITNHLADIDAIEPIASADLPTVAIEGAHQRKRLVQLAALAVLLNSPVRPASVLFLRRLAAHLGVQDGVLGVIDAMVARKFVKARILVMRRGMRQFISEMFQAEGVRGVLRFLGAMWFGIAANRDKLPQYKRLGLLPEGTLGRTYWHHMTERGFGFPGEPGGVTHAAAFHDVAHVMAGYDTNPAGEIQQGSFQGGNRRRDGFFFIQFVILHFHHGIRITPAAPAETGNFHPAAVLWAIHRGARSPIDMTHQWDYWPLMQLPLREARAACELLPQKLHVEGLLP